jgi:hypothetical protein
MSKKKSSTEIATTKSGGGLALSEEQAALAELFGGEEFDTDGLDEAGPEEVRFATLKFNQNKVIDGDQIGKNRFLNTVTQEVKPEVRAIFLGFAKKNAWAEYVNGKTVVHCESDDRVTGTMQDGTQRPCNGCPDARWKTIDGKRIPPKCAMAYKVVGEDLDNGGRPFRIFFRRTAEKAFKQHLTQHHLHMMPNGGHVPLFAYEVRIALEMAPEGTHAVPVIERGPRVDKTRLQALKENAKVARDYLKHDMDNDYDGAEEPANAGETNANDFADDAVVVETTGTEVPAGQTQGDIAW